MGNVIARLSEKYLPIIAMISFKENPAANPVAKPAANTTSNVFSRSANPAAMSATPMSLIIRPIA
jgi:hypothetical protein